MTPRPPAAEPLRARTYLAPGLPLGLFERVCEHLSAALGRPVELSAEARHSGPMGEHDDPFRAGEVDLGFLCSPSYLALRAGERPSVELVPAGFVFQDDRNAGHPVYFSEVVVRAEAAARSLADLEGGTWGFNDPCSLSGYFAALQAFSARACGDDFFARQVFTGSHERSVAAILAGDVDAAAIDSNALQALARRSPELVGGLRVLETWGPFPIQPTVLRADLAPEIGASVTRALLALPPLPTFGLARCAPITPGAYDDEAGELDRLGVLNAACASERATSTGDSDSRSTLAS